MQSNLKEVVWSREFMEMLRILLKVMGKAIYASSCWLDPAIFMTEARKSDWQYCQQTNQSIISLKHYYIEQQRSINGPEIACKS
jgi:hypothetical protein